jgi:hypothetical protein
MTLRRQVVTLIRTVGVLSLMLGVPVSLAGQTCFRGRPQPKCSGFTVLEFTGALRLNDKTGPTDEAPAFLEASAGPPTRSVTAATIATATPVLPQGPTLTIAAVDGTPAWFTRNSM